MAKSTTAIPHLQYALENDCCICTKCGKVRFMSRRALTTEAKKIILEFAENHKHAQP